MDGCKMGVKQVYYQETVEILRPTVAPITVPFEFRVYQCAGDILASTCTLYRYCFGLWRELGRTDR
jgi:hypothetical protein